MFLEVRGLRSGYHQVHLAFGVGREIAVMARGRIVHRCDTLQFRRDAETARRLLGVGAELRAAAI